MTMEVLVLLTDPVALALPSVTVPVVVVTAVFVTVLETIPKGRNLNNRSP